MTKAKKNKKFKTKLEMMSWKLTEISLSTKIAKADREIQRN